MGLAAFNEACRSLGAALHRRVARLRHPAGPLGRLRQRLQDARPRLHGERHVGVQDAVRQGPDLPGLPGALVLLARQTPLSARRPRSTTSTRRARTRRSRSACACSRPSADLDGALALIWTTTPWTLPSNLAVAVHPDVDYVQVERARRQALRAGRGPGRRLRPRARRGADGAAHATRAPSWSGCATPRRSTSSPAGRTRTACSPPTTSPPRTAPGSCTSHRPSVRRTRSSPTRPASRSWSAGRHRRQVRLPGAAVRGPAGVRRQPADHQGPQRRRTCRACCCATRPSTTRTRTAGAAATR